MQFAVIITNYNNAHYLPEAIESVLRQTFKDWELLIVDDCSTDDSIQVIEQYANKDERIKYIVHDKNKGFASALITGVENTSAGVFGSLDSDDALHEDALEVMYDAHRNNKDCSLIYSQFLWCDAHLNPERSGYCAPVPYGSVMEGGKWVSHWKTFKRYYYNQTPGFDLNLKRAVDKDIIYKMEEVGRLLFVNRPLYFYRKHNGFTLSQGKNISAAKSTHGKIKESVVKRRATLCATYPTIIGNKVIIDDSLEGVLPPISLILPYKPDGEQRCRILEWSVDRYKKVFPEFEICIGTNEDELFNKAKAINQAVKKASHDILCMCDTDALFGRELVIRALDCLDKTGCVKVPDYNGTFATGCVALREDSTTELLHSKTPLRDAEVTYDIRKVANHFSLVKRECFEGIYGYDEEFKGWGLEDNAFFRSLTLKYGEPAPIHWPVYHLWHTPSPEMNLVKGSGRKSSKNWKRWQKYKEFKKFREVMRFRGIKPENPPRRKAIDIAEEALFTKADSGGFFNVYIFRDFVLKIPRLEAVNDPDKLQFLADTQTELSRHIPEVLPCYKIGMSLIMPRAPGVSLEKLPKVSAHLEKLRLRVLAKIRNRGYILKDLNRRNVYYDEAEGRIYVVGFHNIKRA